MHATPAQDCERIEDERCGRSLVCVAKQADRWLRVGPIAVGGRRQVGEHRRDRNWTPGKPGAGCQPTRLEILRHHDPRGRPHELDE